MEEKNLILDIFRAAYKEIDSSVDRSISEIQAEQLERLIDILLMTKAKGKKVLMLGAGRSGLVARAFALRLVHLGFNVYVQGETITPAIGKGDLVVAISGSGTCLLYTSDAADE